MAYPRPYVPRGAHSVLVILASQSEFFLSAPSSENCVKDCGGNDAPFIAEIFLRADFAVALTQKKMGKYGKRLSECASSRLRELTPVARGSRGLIIRPILIHLTHF